jgi:hypothetical protein
MTGSGPWDHRRWQNRLLRWIVDPWMDWLYWRLDLNNRLGHPDHGKVLSTFAFFLGCAGIVASSWYLLEHELTSVAAFGFILAYSALVFSMPFGLSGFKVWATTKGGGTVDAASAIATTTINADVAARRQQGGDHEVTQ